MDVSAESIDTIPLTTGDVYQWLEDEGQFPRPFKDTVVQNPQPPAKKTKGSSSQPLIPAILCSVCGLNHQHNPSSATAIKTESVTHAPSCTLVHDDTGWQRMSMLDARRLLGLPSSPISDQLPTPHLLAPGQVLDTPKSIGVHPIEPTSISRFLSSSRDLVAIASPELVIAIQKLIRPLSLPHFELGSSEQFQRTWELDKPRAQVEAQLAPYALMASLTKNFVGLLVNTGMQTATLDSSMAAARARAEGRSTRKTKQTRDRLLTPSHIIRGLAGVQGSSICSATALCLTRLGISASESFVGMGTRDRLLEKASSDPNIGVGK